MFERIDEQRIWARQLLKETKLKRDKEKLQLEIEKLRHEQEKKEIEVLEDDDDGDDGLNIEEEEDNNLTKNSLKSNQNNSAIMEIKERKLLAMRDNTQAHKMPKKYQLRFLAVKLSMGMHVHDGRSDVSPILPWLLIGRKELSFNLQKLLRLGITHILNCTIDVPNSFPAQFVYQRIPINDSMESDFGKFFPVALEFIGRVAAGKGKVNCNFFQRSKVLNRFLSHRF